jgi:hypothetical protein
MNGTRVCVCVAQYASELLRKNPSKLSTNKAKKWRRRLLFLPFFLEKNVSKERRFAFLDSLFLNGFQDLSLNLVTLTHTIYNVYLCVIWMVGNI